LFPLVQIARLPIHVTSAFTATVRLLHCRARATAIRRREKPTRSGVTAPNPSIEGAIYDVDISSHSSSVKETSPEFAQITILAKASTTRLQRQRICSVEKLLDCPERLVVSMSARKSLAERHHRWVIAIVSG
jgi:hypothetical protein